MANRSNFWNNEAIDGQDINWSLGKEFLVDTVCYYEEKFYNCLITNDAYQPDISATYWEDLSAVAEDISITDAGDYFTSVDVEGALQEVGSGSIYTDSDLEVKTLKVNESTDTAAVRGAGTIKLNDDGTNLEVSDGSNWLPVGSTEEGSGFNYDNPNIEINIDGYNTYDDGAVAVPVDGTGGTSANLTLFRETSSPLIGEGSLLITKAAADAQGEGVSYDFTIDEGVRAKTTELKFTYKTDTNYVAGDMGMYLYDIDNDVMLLPSVVDVPVADSAGDYFSTFITSDGANYRLIWHVQTVSALAYTMLVDKIEVGEFSYNLGDGHEILDSEYVDFSGAFESINWNTGIVITPGEYSQYTTTILWKNASGVEYVAQVVEGASSLGDALGISIAVGGTGAVSLFTGAGGFRYVNSSNGVSLVNNSDDGELRVVLTRVIKNINLASDFTEYASNDGSGGTSAGVAYNTGMVNGCGGSNFVVPDSSTLSSSTKYRVTFEKPIQTTDLLVIEIYVESQGVWIPLNTRGEFICDFRRDGSAYYGLGISSAIDLYSVYVAFGNYGRLSGTTYASTGVTWSALATAGWKWRVRKVSNGNMAEVPRMVRAEYTGIQTTAESSNIIWGTEVEDTHNAYDTATGEYTCPVSGVMTVYSFIRSNSVAEYRWNVQIDGSFGGNATIYSGSTTAYPRTYSTSFRVEKGATVTIATGAGTAITGVVSSSYKVVFELKPEGN